MKKNNKIHLRLEHLNQYKLMLDLQEKIGQRQNYIEKKERHLKINRLNSLYIDISID